MPAKSAAPAAASTVERKFQAALAALVERIRLDRSIVAAILSGSLSHDTVWAKSDIDLMLVTADDKNPSRTDISLYADGLNVHAILLPRAEFRKTAEGAVRNSFEHSFIAKGRLLYTHDESIAELFGRLANIGERDTRLQLLAAACRALPPVYKAHKWLVTRGDLEYTALWILYAANALAKIEILGARLLADREVLPQALKLNPQFFETVYSGLLNARKTPKNVRAALDAVDAYLERRTPELFGALIEHLREVGEARSASEIEDYFKRNYGVEGVTGACEYLADRGIFGKASAPARLTRRSNTQVEELAFFYIEA